MMALVQTVLCGCLIMEGLHYENSYCQLGLETSTRSHGVSSFTALKRLLSQA